MDLRERLAEIQDLNDHPPLPTTYYDEAAVKRRYLELLAEGCNPMQAAQELGATGRWFRGFRSERSERFDPEFAARFEEIMAPGGEHREALVGHARAALLEAAKSGNVRAIEKILAAYDPDFQFLRPVAQTGDTNIENMLVVLGELPTDVLEQARDHLVAKMKALPVVDA